MATLSTLGGWAAVIAIIGGYWYYNTNQYKNRRLPPTKGTSKPVESRNPKPKKSRKDGSFSSGDQEVKSIPKTQKKKPQAPKDEQLVQSSPRVQDSNTDPDGEVDNREFARQLASLKTGTIMAPKAQTANKQKSVKQSRAQEKAPLETSSENATAPSSATGGDADDDQSSLNSPELGATAMASPVTNGDVSDMLEAPAPGPSVLKITESNTPARPKKAKPATTFEAVETKKQRQNRKKAEAKKLAREEDEKARQVAMEQQRRTARIAEGRAAKDGRSFMAAKTPSQSAWTAPTTNGGEATGPKVELLDTYEPTSQPATVPSLAEKVTTVPAEALYSEGEMAGSDWQNHFSALPSEEEQTRLALEESDNWKTVKGKVRSKREKPASKEAKQSSGDEQNDSGVPPLTAPTSTGKKWATTLVQAEPDGEVDEHEKELQDSEWEVA